MIHNGIHQEDSRVQIAAVRYKVGITLGGKTKAQLYYDFFFFYHIAFYIPYTPCEFNMHTENDGLEKVIPFNYGYLG